jgi:hypothetical protein
LEKLGFEMNLRKLVDEESMRLKQRTRDKFMLDGDENSKYVHLLAKCKIRKLKIMYFSHGDNVAQDEIEISN